MTDSKSGSLVVGLLILVRHGVHGTDALFFFFCCGVIEGLLFLIQPRPSVRIPDGEPTFYGLSRIGRGARTFGSVSSSGKAPWSFFFNDEENL